MCDYICCVSSLAVGVHWAVWSTVLGWIRCYILYVHVCVCVCVHVRVCVCVCMCVCVYVHIRV